MEQAMLCKLCIRHQSGSDMKIFMPVTLTIQPWSPSARGEYASNEVLVGLTVLTVYKRGEKVGRN